VLHQVGVSFDFYISVKANITDEVGKKADQSNIGFYNFFLCVDMVWDSKIMSVIQCIIRL